MQPPVLDVAMYFLYINLNIALTIHMWTLGTKVLKLHMKTRAAAVLEQLKAVASKTAGREAEDAACPSCTVPNAKHNWRSCLK